MARTSTISSYPSRLGKVVMVNGTGVTNSAKALATRRGVSVGAPSETSYPQATRRSRTACCAASRSTDLDDSRPCAPSPSSDGAGSSSRWDSMSINRPSWRGPFPPIASIAVPSTIPPVRCSVQNRRTDPSGGYFPRELSIHAREKASSLLSVTRPREALLAATADPALSLDQRPQCDAVVCELLATRPSPEGDEACAGGHLRILVEFGVTSAVESDRGLQHVIRQVEADEFPLL